MMETWGYASQVGEWGGVIDIPTHELQSPEHVSRFLLNTICPVFETLHRVRKATMSWMEYSTTTEFEYHELDEFEVDDWNALRELTTRVNQAVLEGRTFAMSNLFIGLDTSVLAPISPIWVPDSAEIQISVTPPELSPATAGVSYTTYIDAWLSSTYGQDYKPRSNHLVATANRDRLHDMLDKFASVIGHLEPGKSQLYHFALTERGFRDVAESDLLGWLPS